MQVRIKFNGIVTEKYLWQGMTRLLAVFDASDNLLMRFEYADARMPVAMIAEGATYYLAFDQVGSLRAVVDGAGNVVKQVDYDSFGNALFDSNPSFYVPFRFAGGLFDAHTGLIRFGYRDYDPDLGRWTSKDPIGFAGGDADLYGYCLGDPVNLVDPVGLLVPQVIGAIVNLAFEGYSQYQSGNLNVGRLVMAAATGALGGFGSTLGRAIFFGAFSNMLNTAYRQVDDPCVGMGQIFRSGLYGAGGGFIGYVGGALGSIIHRPTSPIGQIVGQFPSTHYGAAGAAIGAATGGFIANQ